MKDLGPIFGSLVLESDSVCLVTCIDEKSTPNIITCSAIFPVQPGYVAVAVGFTRYSHDLIKNAGEFAVNIPGRDLLEAVEFCGSHGGRRFKKFEECRLTPMTGRKIKTPLIKECVAWIECENYSSGLTHDHTIFIGQVVAAYAKEEDVDTLFDPVKSINKWGVLSNYSSESLMKKRCQATGADFEIVRRFWHRYYKLWGDHWLKP